MPQPADGLGRRMEQTAANLLDHVLLPQDVPLRQWVLTFPSPRSRLGPVRSILSCCECRPMAGQPPIMA
jgi:hypothetical protein